MEMNQQRRESEYILPVLRKIPFAESLEQLHRHNMHVADVCQKSRVAVVAEYNQTKEKFKKEIEPNMEDHIQAAVDLEKEVSTILRGKHREAKKKNVQNLAKLQHYLAEQRKTITAKQKQMMEESFNRRENHLKVFSATFHHSQDRRYHIREREEKDMQRSLLLQAANKKKIKEANARKQELLKDTKELLQQKNKNVLQVQARSKSRQDIKESASWKQLVKKYEATVMNQSLLTVEAKKRIQDKKKEDEKKLQKQSQRRSALVANKQKTQEQDLKKDEDKIQKANVEKQKYINTISLSIDAKRKLRERKLELNTFYIQEEEQKKASNILQKHHYSQLNLSNFKSEKQRLRRQHFCDFMTTSMKR